LSIRTTFCVSLLAVCAALAPLPVLAGTWGTAVVPSTNAYNDNSIWRAATRTATGTGWNAPAPIGTTFEGGGTPEGAAINAAGEAVVVFHGYASNYVTYILYTNTYHP